ncbi:MAG: hypothetical protein Q4C00_01930 [Bacillota bacterium]|nr:hypothetical protein [Bacillota bacterium]
MAKMLKKKNINFYAAYYRKPAADSATVKKRLIYGVPGGIAVVMLIAGGVIYGQIIYNNMKINDIVEYLEQPEVAAAYEEAGAVLADKEQFEHEIQYFTAIEQDKATYPVFSSDDITRIYGTGSGGTSIKGMAYDVSTGILTVTAEAPRYDYAAQTVAALRNLGLFEDVQYSGYESATTGVYYFEAYCQMEGGGSDEA